jgi:hypothetical protein
MATANRLAASAQGALLGPPDEEFIFLERDFETLFCACQYY